jgi:hypothetical protein
MIRSPKLLDSQAIAIRAIAHTEIPFTKNKTSLIEIAIAFSINEIPFTYFSHSVLKLTSMLWVDSADRPSNGAIANDVVCVSLSDIVAAALMAKMRIAPEDRPRVRAFSLSEKLCERETPLLNPIKFLPWHFPISLFRSAPFFLQYFESWFYQVLRSSG